MKYPGAGPSLTFVAALWLAACGGSENGIGPEPVVIGSVELVPGRVDFFALGGSDTLRAVVTDQGGAPLDLAVIWSSSDPSIATVDSEGVVRANANGEAEVRAQVRGVTAAAPVRVRQSPSRLEIRPGTFEMAPGDTLRLDGVVTDFNGHEIPDSLFPPVRWSTIQPYTALVDSGGLLTAVATTLGLVEVRASMGGLDTATVGAVTTGFSRVAAGQASSCAITTEERAYCWGARTPGHDLGPQNFPARVDTPLSFGSISVRFGHACAVTAIGTGHCWGDNYEGSLGDGTQTRSILPSDVSGGAAHMSVVAGLAHTCAVLIGGDAACWGTNALGVLGDGTFTSRLVPTAVAGGQSWQSIAPAAVRTCALSVAGSAWCWGLHREGSLGTTQPLPDTCTILLGSFPCSTTPVPVAGGHTFVALSTGDLHACGLLEDGSTLCWGLNTAGQLGDGTDQSATMPVLLSGAPAFGSIDLGDVHSCALTPDGEAYCWGQNRDGQLGDGTTTSRTTPTPVQGGHRFESISAGGTHTCGVSTEGSLYCWGDNGDGKVGIDGDALVPALVRGSR